MGAQIEALRGFAGLGYLWFDTAYEVSVVLGIFEALGKACCVGLREAPLAVYISGHMDADNASR